MSDRVWEVSPNKSINIGEFTQRIQDLENQVEQVTKERDLWRQDCKDIMPEADATSWAMSEMQIALNRAAKAEAEVLEVSRKLAITQAALRRYQLASPEGYEPPRHNPLANVQPDLPRANVHPPEAMQTPNPEPAGRTAPATVHDPLADLLGFPKEGR